jgi:hypothetical protein
MEMQIPFDSIYIQTECCVYFTTSLVCRIFTVASRRPQGVIQWTYFVFAFPFRFVYSTLTDIFRFISDTDKLYHIKLYSSPWARVELTTSVVIGTDCIGSCKSNYHMITAPSIISGKWC